MKTNFTLSTLVLVFCVFVSSSVSAQLPGTWTFNTGCNGYSGACPAGPITTTTSGGAVTYNLTTYGSRITNTMWNNTVISLEQAFTLNFQMCFGNHAETQTPAVGGEGIAFGMQSVYGTTGGGLTHNSPRAVQLTAGGYGGGDLGMKCLQQGGNSAFPGVTGPNARTIFVDFDVFDNTAGAGCTGGCLHGGDLASDHIGVNYDNCASTSSESTLGSSVSALASGASICDSVWRNVSIAWVPNAPVSIGNIYDRYVSATDCSQPGTFVDNCGNTVAWSSTTCAQNRNCDIMAVSSGTLTISYNGVVRKSVTLDIETLLNDGQNINGKNIRKDVIFGFSASTEGKTNYQAIRNPVLLPVEFVSFYAVKKSETSADLIWSTAKEENSSRFIVQRSTDGTSWEGVGQINAAGNSSDIKYYVFTDQNLSANTYYYRLQEIDIDGSAGYSKIISINMKGDQAKVDIFPNPASSQQTVSIQSDRKLVSIELIDVNGRSIGFHENIPQGEFNLPFLNIPPGLYFVKIKTENEILIRKFSVQ
jgi:hypothetical protein